MYNSWKPQTRTLPSFIACGLLLGCVSCAAEGYDTPTAKEYDDIARGIAPLVAHELETNGGLNSYTRIVVGDAPWWFDFESNGNLGGSHAGLTWDVDLDCWSAGNSALEVCDDSTDRAELSVAVDGGLNLPRYEAALTVDSTWSFVGLQSNTIIASGAADISADSDFEALFFPVDAEFHFDLDLSYDFQIPTDEYEAISGFAEGTVLASYARRGFAGRGDGRFAVTLRLELAGNGTARLTLDGEEYQLYLETGLVERI